MEQRIARRIEDYALIGDMRTAALVSNDGSIDWLCVPRFDSGACFAALLGTEDNGHWRIGPRDTTATSRRTYRDGTLILETTFENHDGAVTLIDFMPLEKGTERIDLVRIVRCDRGSMEMETEFVLRFEYGAFVPWVRRRDFGLTAIAGPDAVELRTPIELHGKDFRTYGSFTVHEGDEVPFVMTWHQSHLPPPKAAIAADALSETEEWWREWAARCTFPGEKHDLVLRSVMVLKALTYYPTGGIVAAPTTSLPEQIGGVRNWDYRYCWLRDATFTLYALLISGYEKEAADWQNWLLRAVAGKPSDLQIMYGIGGERLLPETEISWLSGYDESRPVRIGNAAHHQFQLDVYGEIMDSFHVSAANGVPRNDDVGRLRDEILAYLETAWNQPDEGLWEVRGPRRHFTHSKVMAWVAVDRAIKAVERFHLEAPIDRWKALRARIHEEVCAEGFNSDRNAFVQYYGGSELDSSLLMIPLVGFLPASDPRVQGTMEAVQRELMYDGLVLRYDTRGGVDGLAGADAPFLACSFWLVDNLQMMGKKEEARALFDRLAGLANDVGLLSEEYDPVSKRMLGNFPQAFSHVGLVNSAHNLFQPGRGPADKRAQS